MDCDESIRSLEESASNDACRASEVSSSVPSDPDLKDLAIMLGGKLLQDGGNCNHFPIVGNSYSRHALLADNQMF